MLVKSVTCTVARFSLLMVPVAILPTLDCGSSDDNTTGQVGVQAFPGRPWYF